MHKKLKNYTTMKKLSFLVLALVIMSFLQSHATVVKGTLVDSLLNEGEPFATVKVFKSLKSDKTIATSLTDNEGNFSQPINNKGKYVMRFSAFGKKDLTLNVTVAGEEEIDLGKLYMSGDAVMMDEVVVTAQKPLVKMTADRLTYNVSEDNESKTYTLLDMLRKVPMVTVDGEDNITVNGSSSFKVYVDGKPSMLFSTNPSQIFKAMPASTVQSIEVVTNPGAQYDAEGAGGVLNLIMDKVQGPASTNGYNATIGARGSNKGYGGNVYLNGQQGKLSYSLNVMHSKMSPGNSHTEGVRTQGDESIVSISNGKPSMPFTMGNLSLEYEINPLTSVGASFAVNTFKMSVDGSSYTGMTGGAFGSGFEYTGNTWIKNNRTGLSGSVDFSRYFDTERKNRFILTYQISNQDSHNTSINDFSVTGDAPIDLTDRESDNKESTTEHVFQADFSLRPDDKNSVVFGAKLMLRKASSDSKYFLDDVLNDSQSLLYDNSNKIGAAYGEYSFSTDKIGAKAGLRYEYTWQEIEYRKGNGKDFSKDYGTLVPSASLSYTLSPINNIGLTYNMRIARPGISYLNPYVDNSTPTMVSYGNPNLDVEKAHNISLVYNYFSPKLILNATLTDNYTGNGIEQFSFYNDGVLNSTYGNIVKRNKIGINTYLNWMVSPKTRIFLNGNVSYVDMRSSKLDAKNSGWQGNAMVGVQQTLPWNIKGGLFLITSSKNYTLQGWSSGFNMISANLSKSLLNDKLSISLGFNTGLSKNGNINMETYSQSKDFTNRQTVKVPMTTFTVGVTYTIGSFKAKTRSNKKTIDSDYIEQKSQMEQLNNNMETGY